MIQLNLFHKINANVLGWWLSDSYGPNGDYYAKKHEIQLNINQLHNFTPIDKTTSEFLVSFAAALTS